jgi:hypothetical protein
VNFVEYWETTPKKKMHFSWVTDLHVTEENVSKIMRGGRARWRIENETFNTLKNQGYHFEHNFGHGKKKPVSCFCYVDDAGVSGRSNAANSLPAISGSLGEVGDKTGIADVVVRFI